MPRLARTQSSTSFEVSTHLIEYDEWIVESKLIMSTVEACEEGVFIEG